MPRRKPIFSGTSAAAAVVATASAAAAVIAAAHSVAAAAANDKHENDDPPVAVVIHSEKLLDLYLNRPLCSAHITKYAAEENVLQKIMTRRNFSVNFLPVRKF
jgi:hypothetical protein